MDNDQTKFNVSLQADWLTVFTMANNFTGIAAPTFARQGVERCKVEINI